MTIEEVKQMEVIERMELSGIGRDFESAFAKDLERNLNEKLSILSNLK